MVNVLPAILRTKGADAPLYVEGGQVTCTYPEPATGGNVAV